MLREPNQPNLIQSQLKQITTLFSISINQCYEDVRDFSQRHPNNVQALEIRAACQSILGNYQRAIKNYQKCQELKPENIAYTNNISWNRMQIRSYPQAASELKQIQTKWHHPSIYWNMALILQKVGYDQTVLIQYLGKKQSYKQFYPDYQQHNGLIHTFLLSEQQNYGSSLQKYQQQLILCLKLIQQLQHRPLLTSTLHEKNIQISQRTFLRQQQQKNYGLVISKQLYTYMKAFKDFKSFIIDCYSQECGKNMDYFVRQAVKQLNQVLMQNINQEIRLNHLNDAILIPLQTKLMEISQDIAKQKVKIEKHNKIVQNQKSNLIKYTRPQPKITQYQVLYRLQQLQQLIQKSIVLQKLIIKPSSTPLAIIVSLASSYIIYINLNQCRNPQNHLTLPFQLVTLITSFQQPKRSSLLTFCRSFSLLLKFYHYYSTQTIKYTNQNRIQKKILSNDYIQMILPVIDIIADKIFNEEDEGIIKVICGEVHYGIVKYFKEVYRTEQQGRKVNILLKRVIMMYQSSNNPIADLLVQILSQNNKQYLQLFLSPNNIAISKSQSFKQSQYFLHKMNQSNILHSYWYNDVKLSQENQQIVSKSITLLLTLALNNNIVQDQQNQHILIEAFLECYYSSTQRQPYRKEIISKYYQANHQISMIEKSIGMLRKIIKKLLF